MATDLIMPKSGLTMEAGTVVEWLVAAGATVSKGQPLLQIETDKVVIEAPAPTAGIMGPPQVAAGQTVPIGALLARIYAPGEPQLAQVAPTAAAPPPAPTGRPTPPAPQVAAAAGGHGRAALPDGSHRQRRQRVFSSPRARKRARQSGLDWQSLTGRGPAGRVIERDVQEALRSRPAAADADVTWLTPTPAGQLAAERMAVSFTSAPHFYLTAEVLVANLLALRQRLLPVVERKTGVRLTVTDLLLKIVAAALAEQPGVNACWQAGRIGQYRQVHVCLAIATQAGLVAPTLRQVDSLTLAHIAVARQALVARARQQRLTADDLQGAAFTLSNLGMYRVDTFQAILNPPQAAILAVGRFADRPVGVAGQLALRPTAHLTLTCDHRLLDGAMGAQFLSRLAELIEEPYGLLA